MEGEAYKKLIPIAQELAKDSDPELIIAALLKLHYQEVFDKENYSNISEVNIDMTGKTRLFIALGRNNGYSPKSLADYIEKITNVKANTLDDIKVMDDFSFVTAPFVDAEIILKTFEKKRESGKRSLVSKAKENKSRGSSSEGFR